MRILIIHNYTEGFATGGEANVFEDEASLLKERGNVVRKLYVSNSEGTESSFWQKIKFFLNAPWSHYGYNLVKKELEAFKPDIVHVHNFFFIFSAKIFLAIKEYGVPAVTTLHNFRLVVPCSQMIYKGKPCDICLGKNPWRILIKRCYRNSFFASLFRYRFYYWSQRKHNWWKHIDRFIALTENGKSILIRGGLPANKIAIKPNFIPDPLPNELAAGKGALYIGRLSSEKGIKELLNLWQTINQPLRILGSGPLELELRKSNRNPQISFSGVVPREKVLDEISDCAFVIVPSIWQEAFGLVNIEALSMGKPILATRNGAMRDIIVEGENGFFINLNNPDDFKRKVQSLLNNRKVLEELGKKARDSYLKKYTPSINYEILMGIYNQAIKENENCKRTKVFSSSYS